MKALATLAASAVLAAGLTSAALAQDNTRIVIVTHGQATDPFWSVVKNGVDHAAKDMGVTVEYRAPDTFDMVQMAQLIDAAVASKPGRPRRLDPGRGRRSATRSRTRSPPASRSSR